MSRVISKKEIIELDFTELNSIHSRIKQSLIRQGYLFVKNHPIDLDLYKRCMSHLINFFRLKKEFKNEFLYSTIEQKEYGNIGYFPFFSETAIDSNLPDIKEFFHIGPLNILNPKSYPENNWPEFSSEFKLDFELLYRQYNETARIIVEEVLKLYNISNDRISELIDGDNSILRLINYPRIKSQDIGNRASEHTGINLIGIQICPNQPGLEIYSKNNEWIRIDKKLWKDNLIINIGEMLPIIIGDDSVIPTLHRVSNPEQSTKKNVSRQSMVFFFHANPYSLLNDSIHAGTWFKQRLNDIN